MLALARRLSWLAAITVALTPAASAESAWQLPDITARTLSARFRQLDNHRAALAAELTRLPDLINIEQGERLGWRALEHLNGPWTEPVWVELDFGREIAFDGIALVPVHMPLEEFPGPGFGFPVRFRIETAGAAPAMLADYTAADFASPGALPVWIDTPRARAQRIRITMTKSWVLTPRFSGIALAEILVLRGARNLATGLPGVSVRTSLSHESTHVWNAANLIDGQSPLGAPLGALVPSREDRGQCWHSGYASTATQTKWVQVDLGAPRPLDEIRLVPARQLVHDRRTGYGFPLRFRIEASDEPDFRQPRLIADCTAEPFVNPGFNVVTFPAAITARHLRITATELFRRNGGNYAFALAELQAYGADENFARAAPVSYLDTRETVAWNPRHLTDGARWENRLGEWPDWIRGLSRRREALAELAAIDAELRPLRVALTRVVGWTLLALAVVAAIAIVAAFYRLQLRRARETELLRRRIASDLHDDLGSNLASMAILSEMCLEARADPPRGDLEEIHRLARSTADALRDVTWLIQPGAHGPAELAMRLRATAKQLLGAHAWTFEIAGLKEALPLDVQRHLLLGLKELLHNAVRHARARTVRICLAVEGDAFRLEVADDGCGFDAAHVTPGLGLASLRHRAASLGGEARFAPGSQGGTVATFSGRLRRARRFALFFP